MSLFKATENYTMTKEELEKKYAVVPEELACDEDELMTPEEERAKSVQE